MNGDGTLKLTPCPQCKGQPTPACPLCKGSGVVEAGPPKK